jgi:VCBS repeat-containing protein
MGQAVATDVEGDALTWQLLDASGQPVAAGSGLHGDHGGVLIMTPTGRWVYQIGPDEAMKLPEGAQAQDHFAFRVTDAHGNSTDSTVTIDITGENNAPIITANWGMGFVDKDVFLTNTDARLQVGVGSERFSGLVIEDTFHAMAGHTSTKTTASSQEIHDGFADQRQSAGQQHIRGQGTGSGATQVNAADEHPDHVTWSLEGSTQGTYGSLALDSTTGEWVYTLDTSRAATQALAAAEVQPGAFIPTDASGSLPSDTFTIKVTDDHGLTDTQVIKIAVVGTNDDPVLSVTQTTPTTGTLTETDVDTGDTHTFSVASGAGQFGTLTVDPDTGAYTYTPSGSVQGMAEDPNTGTYSGTDTFEVTVTDNHGGTDTKYITFSPTGTVSAPTQPGGQPTVTTSVAANPAVTDTPPAAGGTAAPDAPDTTLVEDISITLSPDGLSADGEAAAAGLAVATGADLQIDPDATLEGLLVTTDADGNQQTFDFTQSLGDLSSAAPTADGATVDAATADAATADADAADTASVASSEPEPIADTGGADHLSPYLDMVGAADGGNGGQAGLSASAESPYLDSVGVTPDSAQAGAGADTTLDDDVSVAAADPFEEPPQSETDDPLQAIEGLPDDLPMMEPPPVADLDIDQQHHG